jgi:hypothetical protein
VEGRTSPRHGKHRRAEAGYGHEVIITIFC